jgi:hypothetical protein
MAAEGRREEGREGPLIYVSADQIPYVAESNRVTNNHVALALTCRAYYSYWLQRLDCLCCAFSQRHHRKEDTFGPACTSSPGLARPDSSRRALSPILSHIPSSSPRRPLLLLTTHRCLSTACARIAFRTVDPFSLTGCTGDLALI